MFEECVGSQPNRALLGSKEPGKQSKQGGKLFDNSKLGVQQKLSRHVCFSSTCFLHDLDYQTTKIQAFVIRICIGLSQLTPYPLFDSAVAFSTQVLHEHCPDLRNQTLYLHMCEAFITPCQPELLKSNFDQLTNLTKLEQTTMNLHQQLCVPKHSR